MHRSAVLHPYRKTFAIPQCVFCCTRVYVSVINCAGIQVKTDILPRERSRGDQWQESGNGPDSNRVGDERELSAVEWMRESRPRRMSYARTVRTLYTHRHHIDATEPSTPGVGVGCPGRTRLGTSLAVSSSYVSEARAE